MFRILYTYNLSSCKDRGGKEISLFGFIAKRADIIALVPRRNKESPTVCQIVFLIL